MKNFVSQSLFQELLSYPPSSQSNLCIMASNRLTRAKLTCLTALQIWDTELGPTSATEAISCDVTIPTEIDDLLADIIQAVRACVSAFRNPGTATLRILGCRANYSKCHWGSSRSRTSFKAGENSTYAIQTAVSLAGLSLSWIKKIGWSHGIFPVQSLLACKESQKPRWRPSSPRFQTS